MFELYLTSLLLEIWTLQFPLEGSIGGLKIEESQSCVWITGDSGKLRLAALGTPDYYSSRLFWASYFLHLENKGMPS